MWIIKDFIIFGNKRQAHGHGSCCYNTISRIRVKITWQGDRPQCNSVVNRNKLNKW
ncbi:MAG: hypothetical protein K8S13_01930 [Desulfobacula sp.]|nr:hypothetical protein [Desulfobacula sp.]MCD4718605.1 hypothetical protein [Desulfobacula sp.]